MPRYLLLTQRFPPGEGPATRRLRHLAADFAATGEVFVIRRGEKVADANIFSFHGKDLRRTLTGSNAALPASQKQSWLAQRAVRMRQAFPFVYLTDDGGTNYRRQALVQARWLIQERGITTIFSSFRPWSDHLVAQRLKTEFPHLHWIADFRDLPVDPVRRDVWWPGLQRWWGRWVIRSADEIWVVSRGQQVQLTSWHPNVRVRYNALLALPPVTSAPPGTRFSIVYTGSLYPGLQSLEPLLTALEELIVEGSLIPTDLQLCYRGKDVGLFQRWTAGLPAACLDTQPTIAPAAAQKMQQSAQVLLLLNWSAPGYYGVLTAKLWDYLTTGRPILALVNGPGDEELTEIIAGAGAGAVFTAEELGAVKDWLRTAYRSWQKRGHLPWSIDRDYLRRFL